MSDTLWSPLQALFHLIFTITYEVGYYVPDFLDEETVSNLLF